MRFTLCCVGLLLSGVVSCQKQEPTTPGTDTTSSPRGEVRQENPAEPAKQQAPAKKPAKKVAGPEEVVPVAPDMKLSTDEIKAGWIQLFDGQTLFGWKPNNDVNWSVADGVIQADAGEPGLLLTTVPFTDYELRCDFRLEKGGNSGVFLRTIEVPKDPSIDCYELNMCDSHESFPTGSIVARKKIGQTVVGEEAWKTFHVRIEGLRMVVQLDGKEILDFTDDSKTPRKTGLIGLQKNAGKIEFRNVFLRPLSTQPLFNGKDLTGWREVPGSKSKFTVADKTIHVSNGPGFLETEKTWDNFVLQFEAISNGKELNSGIFFRSLPGEADKSYDGYELQIHNGFENGDRGKPNNAGTGSIFRRTTARWVVSSDNEWFTSTLVAHGPNMAVWVDGHQVTAWTDTRELGENPRRHRRDKPGHFALQGHDPTTDLAFRNLRIVGFPVDKAD